MAERNYTLRSLADAVDEKKLINAIGALFDYALNSGIGMLQTFDELAFLSQSNLSSISERVQELQNQYGESLVREVTIAPHRALQFLPISALPAPLPKSVVTEAFDLMQHFNRLMHCVAHDYEFLSKTYEEVLEVDDFQARLWAIYETIRKEGSAQTICFQTNRNDFMVEYDEEGFHLRQVEINLISAGLGFLSDRVFRLHRYALNVCDMRHELEHLVPNSNCVPVAQAYAKAWHLFGDENAAILFVIQNNERNIMDQRTIEFAIYDAEPRIRVIRRTLEEVGQHAVLDENTRRLTIDGTTIALVYFRAGYTPRDYPNELCWSGRIKMERSTAIKSPTIAYHLANSKKVQQALCEPGTVEKYISDPAIAKRIRSTFAMQFTLDDKDAVERALANPEAFVLKPNREGGGSNLYNAALAAKLQEVCNTPERHAYVLMQRIRPFEFSSYLLTPNRSIDNLLTKKRCALELGIFGVLMSDRNDILMNQTCGYLLRTKTTDVDECGVSAGYAAVDTICAIDDADLHLEL